MRCLITGITGTLGTALTNIHVERGDQVWGTSRSEGRAVEWLREHGRKATHYLMDTVHFGKDDCDASRILPTMDRVYHCAAMKHVEMCEANPIQAILDNVVCTDILLMRCLDEEIPAIHISSDKACLPQGVYGATKLLSESVALRRGAAVVRLGNIIGSSGSVFHIWKEQRRREEKVTVTDPEMTRFFIPVKEVARFIADEYVGGVIVIPEMKSVKMGDAASYFSTEGVEVVGRRPGETKHQWLIAPGDMGYYDVNRRKWVLTDSPPAIVIANGIDSEKASRWDMNEMIAHVNEGG